MAEAKEKAKPAAAPAAAAAEGAVVGMAPQKKAKDKWTLERCKKAARRFTTAAEWSDGAPASFKAANAKGWFNDCSAHMKAIPMKRAKSA